MGRTVAYGAAGAQGVGYGAGGAAAGGRIVRGTAIKGPEGNEYTHETFTGRGIAAGPESVAASSHISTGTPVPGLDGNAFAQRAAAGRGFVAGSDGAVGGRRDAAGRAYTTAYRGGSFSPTRLRADGLACQDWCNASGCFTRAWSNTHPWACYPGAYATAAWVAAVWTPASWTDVGSWLGWGSVPTYAYDYGTDITYQNGEVYFSGQPAGTATQYYYEVAGIASSGARGNTGQDANWLPLGVFGLMPQGQKTPRMVFQIAMNKGGIIRGNFYDQITKTNMLVTGAVDKKTQRVAWKAGNNSFLVVETGLYNLTQNESTALVHEGPVKTQVEILVRLQRPSVNQPAQS